MAAGRKTGGRAKGTLNKATADIKALAMKHAPAAMTELARLATKAESEAARVAAIKELFDRGFGKATQSIDVSNPDGTLKPPSVIQIVGVRADDSRGDQAT